MLYKQTILSYAMFLVGIVLVASGSALGQSYDCSLVGAGTNYANPFSPNGAATVDPPNGGLLNLNLTGGTASATSGIWNLSATGGASVSILGLGLVESAPSTKLLNGDLKFDITQKPDSLLSLLGVGTSLQYQWSAAGTFSTPELLELRPNSAYQVSFDVDGSNGLLKTVLGLVPTFNFQMLDGAGNPIASDSSGTLINLIGLLGTGVTTGSITISYTTGATVPAGPIRMMFSGKAVLGATALGLGTSFATVSNLKLKTNACLSLGNLVWHDADANGLKNVAESGVGSLAVQLYKSTDDVAANGDDIYVEATTTNSFGAYLFQKLPPGKYVVKVTPPAAYPLSSYPVVTLDNQINNDNNGNQPGGQGTALYSPVVTLSAGNESMTDGDTDSYTELTVDFGLRECDVIVITPPVLAPGNVNATYSEAMTATGGSGVYSWVLVGVGIPSGLSFSTTGIVGGVPTLEGTFLFVVRATDTHGCTGIQQVSVTIRPLPIIHALAKDGSGRYLAGGSFYEVSGVSRVNLARLNRDGTVDQTFAPAAPNGPVYCIEVRGSSIYVGGSFTDWGGEEHRGLVKLNEDGSRDTAFASPAFSTAAGDGVRAISKTGFYVAGNFTAPGKGVIAVDPSTGAVSNAFVPLGPNIGGGVSDVVYDGSRVVVAGNFTTFNSSSRRGIAALATDGALDSGWGAGSVANGDGKSLISLRDSGELLFGGSFTTYSGNSGLTGTARIAPSTGALAAAHVGTAGLSVNSVYKISEP